MKNIKKFYPLIVGLVLLISVAAYGTRAYFSDSTKEDAGIELKLGHVEIESFSTPWTINEKGTNNKVGKTVIDGKTYINKAKPGDSFSKTFTFTNKSSLKTKFKMTQNITTIDKKTSTAFDVSLKLAKGKYNNIEYPEVKITNPSYSSTIKNPENPKETIHEILLEGKEQGNFVLTVSVKDQGEVNDYNRAPESADAFVLDLLNEMIEVELIDADGSIAE
ncbi:hypothetical protein ACQKKE_10815 [Desemzia incerta]|uniref:hypothetical protein n=1 Tax=Desemzia incerta TaxID=82801 RepID=UPI003D03F89D